ncbi:MAG: hypothetical protein AAFX76_00425 [Planctomycetota bacterium]
MTFLAGMVFGVHLWSPAAVANTEDDINDQADDDDSASCHNEPPDESDEEPDDGCDGGDGSENSEGSFAEAISRVYMHYGNDYESEVTNPMGLRGCYTCSTPTGNRDMGVLPSLKIQRIHKEHSGFGLGGASSFGNRVSLSYDISLKLKEGASGSPDLVRVIDPASRGPYYDLKDDGDVGVAGDGKYTGRSTGVKELCLYDSAGALLTSFNGAATADLLFWDGRKYVFEIIDDGRASGDLAGRVLRLEDRNGNAISFQYTHPRDASDARGGGDRRRLWLRDSVTDAYGRVATFSYSAQPLYGWNWYVVESIDLPNGQTVRYRYNESNAAGRLSGVDHPDGSESAFAYAYDAQAKADRLEIDDPAAGTTHRRKEVFFTSTHFGQAGQAPGRLKKIINGEGELSYAVWTEDIAPDTFYTYVFEGGRKLKRFRHFYVAITRQEQAIEIDPNGDGSFDDAVWELVAEYDTFWRKMPRFRTDRLGRVRDHSSRDTVRRTVSEVTHYDGQTEQRQYDNAFNFLTRHTDRLGRVTDYQLDANGNVLSKTEAFGTADAATWQWTYTAQGLVETATDANGNVTEYAYSSVGDPDQIDGTGYLVRVTEPADSPGGPRAVTLYEFDTAGRLVQTTDPEQREMQYGYDARNRRVSISYPDNSTESVEYAVTGEDAGLIVRKTDRNGNVTTCEYDRHGRKTLETVATNDPGISIETAWTYLRGTNLVETRVDAGSTTRTLFDHFHRRVGSTAVADGGSGAGAPTSHRSPYTTVPSVSGRRPIPTAGPRSTSTTSTTASGGPLPKPGPTPSLYPLPTSNRATCKPTTPTCWA